MKRTAKERRELIDLMRGYSEPTVRRARQGRERGEKPIWRKRRAELLLARLAQPTRRRPKREKYPGQSRAYLVGAWRGGGK